jgi:hypothetical protein
MTRSKLEYAQVLANLRGLNEDPEELAKNNSLRKLCYELEKLEELPPCIEAGTVPEPEPEKPREKSLMDYILGRG